MTPRPPNRRLSHEAASPELISDEGGDMSMTRIDSPKPQMPDGAERRPSLHRLLRVGLAGFLLLAVPGGAIALGATDEPTAETSEPSGSAAAVPTSDSRVDPPQTTTTWGPSATPGVESTPVPESTISTTAIASGPRTWV